MLGLVLVFAVGTGPVAMAGLNNGNGCEKRMTKYCPDWKTNLAACLACVEANIAHLEPNCTLAIAEKKCHKIDPPGPSPGPPAPEPPAPPAPPLTPRPDAPRPHVVLFVVDDQASRQILHRNFPMCFQRYVCYMHGDELNTMVQFRLL